jgi:integrase
VDTALPGFYGWCYPTRLGATEVEGFLTHLAVKGRVSASTQNQAKSALLFLYREVLGIELPWLDGIQGAKTPRRLPVVLTRTEVAALLERVQGMNGVILHLLYGAGLRLMEALRLRVKDLDFERTEILVRDGKGAKDRVTMLPASLLDAEGAASSVLWTDRNLPAAAALFPERGESRSRRQRLKSLRHASQPPSSANGRCSP